jgi:peptidoglycan/LPS O-acetylase OafA/YrhL
VSAVSIRRLLRRARWRFAAVVAVLAIAGLVAAHHGMPMDMHEMPTAAMCLAVLGAGVAIAAGIGGASPARLVLPGDWVIPAAPRSRPRSVPARAGPLYLRFVVLRR